MRRVCWWLGCLFLPISGCVWCFRMFGKWGAVGPGTEANRERMAFDALGDDATMTILCRFGTAEENGHPTKRAHHVSHLMAQLTVTTVTFVAEIDF